eukprot:4986788-Ditylum_brightwellii.AAC.1
MARSQEKNKTSNNAVYYSKEVGRRIAKIENISQSLEKDVIDLWQLRQFALSRGGFIDVMQRASK